MKSKTLASFIAMGLMLFSFVVVPPKAEAHGFYRTGAGYGGFGFRRRGFSRRSGFYRNRYRYNYGNNGFRNGRFHRGLGYGLGRVFGFRRY